MNDHYKPSNKTFTVVDVQIAEKSHYISEFHDKSKLTYKRNKLIRKWVKKYDDKANLPRLVTMGTLKKFFESLDLTSKLNRSNFKVIGFIKFHRNQ